MWKLKAEKDFVNWQTKERDTKQKTKMAYIHCGVSVAKDLDFVPSAAVMELKVSEDKSGQLLYVL